MRSTGGSVVAGLVLLLVLAPEGAAAASGDDWDGAHMQSRYRSLLDAPRRRPSIEGADRYQAIASSPGPVRTEIPSSLPAWTQRPWQSCTSCGSPFRRSVSSFSHSPALQATRRQGTPGGKTSAGGSQLRNGVRGGPGR